MSQEIKNEGSIDRQLNVQDNSGPIYFKNRSRLSTRFEKLKHEVESNSRYEGVKEALKYYLTKLDGVDVTKKLVDGGLTETEILRAIRRKEKYAKQLEKNKFYESAQIIDSEIFAKIIIDFETYVEIPLINNGASKSEVFQAVLDKVISPILTLINEEGEHDNFLNYTVEDIYGMIYYLTGKCHINWKNYDSL